MLARGVSPSQRVRKLLFDRDRSPLVRQEKLG